MGLKVRKYIYNNIYIVAHRGKGNARPESKPFLGVRNKTRERKINKEHFVLLPCTVVDRRMATQFFLSIRFFFFFAHRLYYSFNTLLH